MPYGVTTSGFVKKTLADIREDIEDYQTSEIDAGLDHSDGSALSQVNLSHANQLAELWDLAQAVYAAAYPDSAEGATLDQVCSITGTVRSAATKTTVTGQVTLNPNKALPAGSVAHLTSQPNARFVTLTTVPAAAAGGTFSVVFEAETAGAAQVAIGQLSAIAEPVSGWTAVTNAAAGATGTDRETDPELRVKREEELDAQGATNVDSIRSAIRSLTGVVDASVTENVTNYIDAAGLKPHSIWAVVRGGTSADIAEQIFESKAAGIDTNGTQSETVTDSDGNGHTILFDFAGEKVVHVEIAVVKDGLVFDAVNGPGNIKTRIAAYINALGVGDNVIYDLVKCAAFDEPGVVSITTLKIGFVDPPTGTGDLTIAATEYASSDTANIDVTVS